MSKMENIGTHFWLVDFRPVAKTSLNSTQSEKPVFFFEIEDLRLNERMAKKISLGEA